MADATCLPLEMFYRRERLHPEKLYMVQPQDDGTVENLTWQNVGEQARRAAGWLRERQLPAGSRVAIISKNCAHWIITDLAIWMAGHVSVPLYPNLTADSVRQVLQHAEVELAFVGKLDNWAAMAPGVPENVPTIGLPLCPSEPLNYSWHDLQQNAPISDSPTPAADQLASIIYTSGTTGMPKGVMHHFSNFAFAAVHSIEMFTIDESDRVLSYLPLCHIAERMFVEMSSFYGGQTVFFAQNLDTFLNDLKRARPTLLFGVPRIWIKFQMGVFSKMPAERLDFMLKLPLIGKRVGNKVLSGLGLDAVRLALSGAAPVPEALLKWYQRLGLDVLEVYGMTENCGYSHVCRNGKFRQGWIGQNSIGVEVRIDDNGEVLVRSGANMQGYYKEPAKTAEAMTADGFLRTGDKGEQDAEGYLRLTGRIKEIFKTSKGKYVAPAPIENRLAVNTRIEQVCVIGDSMAKPLALCVLSDVGRHEAANGARVELEQSLKSLLEEVNAKLDQHERLQSLVLVGDVWSIENGYLTPTLKIKRTVVEDAYKANFTAWSERQEPVIWA